MYLLLASSQQQLKIEPGGTRTVGEQKIRNSHLISSKRLLSR